MSPTQFFAVFGESFYKYVRAAGFSDEIPTDAILCCILRVLVMDTRNSDVSGVSFL